VSRIDDKAWLPLSGINHVRPLALNSSLAIDMPIPRRAFNAPWSAPFRARSLGASARTTLGLLSYCAYPGAIIRRSFRMSGALG